VRKFVYRLLLIVMSLLLIAGMGIACAEEEEPTPTPGITPTPGVTPTPTPTLPPKDTIKICAARSLSGGLEMIGDYALGPVLEFWEAEVNARGGIYVEEYGKQLLLDIDITDDTSDIGLMTSLLTGMIMDPDCDFVLPPISTAFLQAAAEIVHTPGYEHVLMGAEGGCTSVTEDLVDLPYLFAMLNYSNHNQMEELFKLLDDWRENYHGPDYVMKVYVTYINDLHGLEYRDEFRAEADNYPGKFNIVKEVALTPYEADVSAQLLEAKNTYDVDVFCSFSYPPTPMATVGQAIALDINFNAMVLGPGGNFQFFYEPAAGGFGPAVDGVIGFGAWNEYSSAAAAQFTADMTEFFADQGGRLRMGDWWGALPYYAGLQCFEQAIEAAGTLDQSAIRDVLATETFDTVLGETWFGDADGTFPIPEGGGLMAKECYAGQIGQWQYDQHGDGMWIFEVIDIGPNNTAEGVYPKPDWPAS